MSSLGCRFRVDEKESVESEVKEFCDLVQVSRGFLWQLWLVDVRG